MAISLFVCQKMNLIIKISKIGVGAVLSSCIYLFVYFYAQHIMTSLLSHILGYILAVSGQFVLLSYWAFYQRKAAHKSRMVRFMIQVVVILIITTVLESNMLRNDFIEGLIIMGIITLINLTLYFLFTFKDDHMERISD